MFEDIKKLRRTCAVLTVAGEAEAIGQVTGKTTKYNLSKEEIWKYQNEDTFTGHKIDERIVYLLNKLQRRIFQAIELSAISGSDIKVAMQRVERVLPKRKKVSVDQRNVTVGPVLKESNTKKEDIPDMSQGYIDDQTWEEMVDSYLDENVPKWRGSDEAYTVSEGTKSEETIYQIGRAHV